LKGFLPRIFNSAQYKAGHVVIFIATDEALHGVKPDYKNEIRYTHSSLDG
jgi:hypothetical protein